MAKEREEQILKFWQDYGIFQKSLDKESPKGEYVFYDGPPFATGLPHFGHVLPTTLKDLIPRYKTMQGYSVRRRWGWDCHGLPVENLVEKELGFTGKKDIEEYGVEKFNQACRESVLRYADEWRKIVPRVGRWVDMVDDYRTMDSSYTESVWWVFKSLHEKNLVYEGFKSMQLCPRCETTLSNFEVNQGYKDITDISVYVKFELADEPGTFLLAWTTTPWTLPGNAALAVNPATKYSKIKIKEETFILAKDLVDKVFKDSYEFSSVGTELEGSELVGKKYKPIFDYYTNDEKVKNKENGWKVYGADFVTTEDGTGIVHIAPAFGSDDYELSKKENLPFIQHVNKDGTFKSEVTDFAGQQVKPKSDEKDGHQKTDIEVIKYLAKQNILFKKEKLVHSYPHCWRCDTPLLNYATSSWFVRVSDFKSDLVRANEKVKWVPESVGRARFGNWLEEARDWNVSRQRYWGAPIPVWKCNQCQIIEVFGSIEQLKKQIKPRNTYYIMRHGQADHNIAYITSCDQHKKYHLTEKGREQVEISALTLKDKNIDIIFSSPLTRTMESAEIVVETIAHKGEVITDERLREYGFGDLDGKLMEEYHRFYNSVKEQLDKRIPNGENIRDVAARIVSFMYEIDATYEGKNILIVTHDGPASILFATADGGRDRELINFWAGDFLETGHLKQLEFVPLPHNDQNQLDFHRPFIDKVQMSCSCGGTFARIPDVFDCWFESGSMPYGEVHYPFNHEVDFTTKHFPADFIAEGLDQTRGWFYSLMVLGTALFGTSPYKNVLVNGLVLAEDGKKMSKKLNNYPPLLGIVDKYGADAVRFFLMQSPLVKAEDVAFSEKGVDEINKKILLRLQNVVSFYEMFADDSFKNINDQQKSSSNLLDQWIIARLNDLGSEMTKAFDVYEVDRGVRPVMSFIDDLSTWYIRRSRDRFKSDDIKDKTEGIATTRFVLLELSKLIAPVMPFYAEELYQKVKGKDGKESVHLENWSQFGNADEKVIEEMKLVRELVEKGLSMRNDAAIKVRQPLAAFTFENNKENKIELGAEYLAIIADELNVKEVKEGEKFELDTTITPELKAEGAMRDLVRAIQDKRKEENWVTSDRGNLVISEKLKETISQFENEIKKVAGIDKIEYENIENEFELKKV